MDRYIIIMVFARNGVTVPGYPGFNRTIPMHEAVMCNCSQETCNRSDPAWEHDDYDLHRLESIVWYNSMTLYYFGDHVPRIWPFPFLVIL